jgi:uncharacterized protein YbjT (DUF2867 family)
MKYVVTGATGAVGGALMHQLLEAGHQVTAVSRDPKGIPASATVVQADFTTGDLPAHTFDHVAGVFVFPAHNGIGKFLDVLKQHRIEHIVLLSSLAAAQAFSRDKDSISALHHLKIESDARASGIQTTILRPGTFANNLLYWSFPIRMTGVVQGPYAESRQAPIHERDIAAAALCALTDKRHFGNTFALSGPEALTRVRQLETIGNAIGKTLRYEEITPEAFAQSMSAFMPPPTIKMMLDHWSDTVHEPDVVYPTITQMTGRPARTLEDWARDHAADFS